VISDDEAAKVLLERSRARNSLAKFSEFINPDEPPALHHRLLCDALDSVVEGKIRRLMVFMPPGSAKSTYGSVRFPSYYLGRFPANNIITASADKDLANSFGRKVRNTVDSEEYSLLFDTKLADDLKAKGEWATNKEGTYKAVGVQSNVVGRRADLGLIDDPTKGIEDADSPLVRNRVWAWYKADFFPRLKPNSAQIIIQTRWNIDDLSGRILPPDWNGESGDFEGFDGQIWKVICIPAQARENDILGRKVGDWLWLEWFHEQFWKETKAVQMSDDTRNWEALYQQVPQPETGVFFQRDMFKRYKIGEEPKLTLYGASDCGVSDNAGDSTEHGVGGFDKNEDLYFTDWWSGKVTMDVWIDSQIRMAKRHSVYDWYAEVGVIRKSSEPYLIKRKRELNAGYVSQWLPHLGDKAANAQGFRALASAGRVYIPRCEWGDALINQLVRFIPNANLEDDKVDVCGLFGRILNRTFGAQLTVVPKAPETDMWGRPVQSEENWKVL